MLQIEIEVGEGLLCLDLYHLDPDSAPTCYRLRYLCPRQPSS